MLIDLEFVFAKDLHMPPSEFNRLPFYESMMIYRRYAKWVEEQEDAQKVQAEEYEAKRREYEMTMPKVPDYSKNFKMPDMNSIAKGFTQQMPKF